VETPAQPGATQRDDLQARLEELEGRLQSMERSEGATEVETAQQQVGRLLSRIHLVDTHVIVTALEGLVEAAQASHHKEASYYKKALAEVKRHEGAEGFGSLVLQLFGSGEDKKISSVVQSWHKLVKAEGEGKSRPSGAVSFEPAQAQVQHLPPHYPPPVYPMAPYAWPQQQPFGYGGFSPRRGRGGSGPRRATRSQQDTGRCYGCGEQGHRVADCKTLKDFRARNK